MPRLRLRSPKEQSLLGPSPRPITNTPDYSANLYFMGMLQGDTGAGGEASDMLRYTGQQLAGASSLPARAIPKYLWCWSHHCLRALWFLFHLAFYDSL